MVKCVLTRHTYRMFIWLDVLSTIIIRYYSFNFNFIYLFVWFVFNVTHCHYHYNSIRRILIWCDLLLSNQSNEMLKVKVVSALKISFLFIYLYTVLLFWIDVTRRFERERERETWRWILVPSSHIDNNKSHRTNPSTANEKIRINFEVNYVWTVMLLLVVFLCEICKKEKLCWQLTT